MPSLKNGDTGATSPSPMKPPGPVVMPKDVRSIPRLKNWINESIGSYSEQEWIVWEAIKKESHA